VFFLFALQPFSRIFSGDVTRAIARGIGVAAEREPFLPFLLWCFAVADSALVHGFASTDDVCK
jgi:hypothetical protein